MTARDNRAAKRSTSPASVPLPNSPATSPARRPSPAPLFSTMKTITNPYFRALDMKTDSGFKLHQAATKGLAKEQKFGMLISGIRTFKIQCARASKKYNWGLQVTAVLSTTDPHTYDYNIRNFSSKIVSTMPSVSGGWT